MRIYMQFNDLEKKVVRYYQLVLQQDLLGDWSLITENGIQGESGRINKKQFSSFEEAEKALLQNRDRQLRRGYQVVFVRAMHPGSSS